MKLVFPGGEHPQVLLGPGINRVGSDPAANVVLDRPGVMPRHCELHLTGTSVMLQVPAGASVEVNGRAVSGLIALRPGDVVGFEQVQARLASVDAGPPTALALDVAANSEPLAADDSTRPAFARSEVAATTVRPALPSFVLRGVSAAGFGRTFPLLGPTLLGRAPDCGIQLDYPGLSRHHARLTPTVDGLLVEDLGSTNGCLVNDARVDRAWAQHGDEIGFDLVRFRVVAPGRGAATEVRPRSTRPVAVAGSRGALRLVFALAAAAAVTGVAWAGMAWI